jgi:hypothetical protein
MLHRMLPVLLLSLTLGSPVARAGLYYSGETFAEFPSQWRGYLLDQRLLRQAAVKPVGNTPNPVRKKYEAAVEALAAKARDQKLTADECADLGALYLRLGDAAKAVEVLRKGQRDFDKQFRIMANLGTSWQLAGDIDQAIAALEEAVKLAPGKFQKVEELHLRLLRLRRKEAKGADGLDALFGVHYATEKDNYEAGKIAEAEWKKLPDDAAAQLQQLALALPADGRLLWQLGELANACGDIQVAAAIMDGCVGEFGMRKAELGDHRRVLRAAADELTKKAAPVGKEDHVGHVTRLKAKSTRPLLQHFDQENLPEIKADGLNPLPWSVLTETKLDRKFKPTFARYLQQLDGKHVSMTGYMQPIGEDIDCAAFILIENPVGCWYCEMPDITAMLQVEMPAEKTFTYTRKRLRIEGTLLLNGADAESFLYTIRKAKVVEDE